MASNSTPMRLPSTTLPLSPSPASDARVLDVVGLVELDVPIVAVARLDFSDIHVLHDVARRRIDRHRPPRTGPRHALHRRNDFLAIAIASRLLDRFVDQMHTVVVA